MDKVHFWFNHSKDKDLLLYVYGFNFFVAYNTCCHYPSILSQTTIRTGDWKVENSPRNNMFPFDQIFLEIFQKCMCHQSVFGYSVYFEVVERVNYDPAKDYKAINCMDEWSLKI